MKIIKFTMVEVSNKSPKRATSLTTTSAQLTNKITTISNQQLCNDIYNHMQL